MALKLDILKDAKNTDSFRSYSYADLHLDLELSSYTSDKTVGSSNNAQDLKLNYDENAIYNSIRNIFNTKKGQKILTPTFGLDIEQYLFENISKANGELIGTTIFEELSLYDPRIIVDNVDIVAGLTTINPERTSTSGSTMSPQGRNWSGSSGVS